MIYKKNDYVTVTIEDMSSKGEGIGKADGFTLFVKDAVIGDTVEAKITKSKKNYAFARLEKIIVSSPFRVNPKCPYHRQCGGCQIQALSYEKQLEFKNQKIRNNMIHIGNFQSDYLNEIMEPIIGMEEPYHYRNKAQYPVGTDKEGNIVTGFYAGNTHNIIPNTNCFLGMPENEIILNSILDHMRENKISAYDEITGKGLVRHILIRTGFFSGEIMVCLVINRSTKGKEEFIPAQQKLLGRLIRINGIASISVNINTSRDNVIMGKEIHTLWGKPTISDIIHVRDMSKENYPYTGQELSFKISPLSFYQINPVQTEKLYSLALEYAGLTGKEIVWDLYCGIGTISLFLAVRAKKVYGVEIIPQAIEDARENAKINHIENAEFFVGKAEEILPGFYNSPIRNQNTDREIFLNQENTEINSYNEQKSEDRLNAGKSTEYAENIDLNIDSATMEEDMLHPDVIVVDPPRKGCDEECLHTMIKMRPERIVYVSCDSATLARDLKILCDGGYELKRIRGVDQFGMTVHVETVCLLSKLNVEHHIEVELNLDEMDLTVAESKATYEEIRAYVKEKTGLQVSNLYIAQIKRKCGIVERVNYNLPKSEDPKQPNCPPEKEKAIMEALRYFKMI